ncbi:INO80 complex subunit E isoform X8 [Prionailurus bengalensis]|uniref:INO80 complex subunit E isoform X8 n=1 Tax=Prionailurus bengalensis TaxID=37029 RepID=UPI001CA9D5E5|nr:INO80 complex subunit E isoform X8 [Prionailurus bengalensis]
MNGPADGEVDYKKKYRNLKRKLKFLIYEHECFQEELRKAQRKLLKVSRDKSFLLDRLLQYENVDEDSSDSDATASSDNSETEGTPKLSDTPAPKSPLPCPFSRKRSPPLGGVPSPSSLSLPPSTGFPLQASGAPSPYLSSMAVGPPDCPVGGPLTFPGRGSGAGVGAALAPLPPPKMPPPTILSAVPRQMFSDTGSGDDALDGDDDLVIDIPE